MKDTKLVDILKTLTTEELREFRKFVVSPYHKKRDVEDLFNALRPFHPNFEEEKLTNEYIYNKLFPGKKFGDKKSDSLIKTLSSDLFALCKEFLIQLEFEKNENYRRYFLLQQLRKRKLYSEHVKEAKPAKAYLEKESGNDFELIQKFYLSSSMVEYHIDAGEFAECYENVIEQSEYLSAAALIGMLRFSSQQEAAEYGYNLKTRKNLTQAILSHLNVDALIDDLKANGSRYHAFIEINYIGHLINKSEMSKDLFYKMKKLLSDNHELLSERELYIFYSMLTAYGHKVFAGSAGKESENEVFELYSKMIELDAYKFSSNDYFQVGLFRGMLITARASGKLEWMKMLIDEKLKELHPNYIDNMKSYAMGQYYYGMGLYEKALESLIVLKSDYFLYKKDLKNLLFRIYYELGYIEESYSMLENMKKYLSNTDDLSDRIKKLSQNFVRFAGELLKARDRKDKMEVEFLKKSIRESDETESANWLVEKLNEINK
ncbi:MAG: hypothetical protein IPG99_02365 [Ignavibacteria bacterium]|jgi:hypothetical protein|nr:hypothetical protein [Ignavibacteria bacterium]